MSRSSPTNPRGSVNLRRHTKRVITPKALRWSQGDSNLGSDTRKKGTNSHGGLDCGHHTPIGVGGKLPSLTTPIWGMAASIGLLPAPSRKPPKLGLLSTGACGASIVAAAATPPPPNPQPRSAATSVIADNPDWGGGNRGQGPTCPNRENP
ncbi:hypothetical protein CRG98_005952 [Punica granatum]|uniref:Uncharacterized protein n=1 Tax=Punica granatum TaxID=22663 RepID=A0A2I0KZ28_PUNGR|nr:hypothetical protein CRG98_005952 [Punica granatum]